MITTITFTVFFSIFLHQDVVCTAEVITGSSEVITFISAAFIICRCPSVFGTFDVVTSRARWHFSPRLLFSFNHIFLSSCTSVLCIIWSLNSLA
jgi:hypothetical protein